MPEDFLIVKDLTKEFTPGLPIVRNISFTLGEAKTFGLLGKSGQGKSVIMQAIRGVPEYEPTRGEIIFRVA
ncbi:MAG: ATP-binding cassette domain-containing protein [Candidatus Hadarchaeales archaeon]